MGDDHRGVALGDAQRDEEQEERDADDDVAVEDGDVVDELYRLACPAVAEVVDADGGDGAEEGGDGGGDEGDGHGVRQCRRQGVVGALGEEVLVELQGEARPVAHHLRLGEGEDDDDEDGGVEQQEEQPEIALAEHFLQQLPVEQ